MSEESAAEGLLGSTAMEYLVNGQLPDRHSLYPIAIAGVNWNAGKLYPQKSYSVGAYYLRS